MEYNSYLQKCNNDAVISIETQLVKLEDLKRGLNWAFRKDDVMIAQYKALQSSNISVGNFSKWYQEGINAEILNPGSKGWKKGKIRIKVTLEFCPDEAEGEEAPASNQPETSEAESPLDEIRRMMTEDNS